MEINEITAKVFPMKGDGSTKAFASVAINDAIVINGVRVVDGANGLFVSMPQSKDKEGNFRDIVFAKDGELKAAIAGVVLGEYEKAQVKEAPKKSMSEKISGYKAAQTQAQAASTTKAYVPKSTGAR